MLSLFGANTNKEQEAIDYRPRAPLVVPPGRDLPEPRTTARDPAWPKDVDAIARRRASLDASRPAPGATSLTKAEPASKDSEANAAAPANPDAHEEGCLLNSSGPQSCFNFLPAVFGGEAADEPKPEPGVEPSRKVLTEPPAGYRASLVVPAPADGQSRSEAKAGPFDSVLAIFGMKKADE
jgi:hypothetical protein